MNKDHRTEAPRLRQDEAQPALTPSTDLEAVYTVTTVTERISLTPAGEQVADRILAGR